MRIILIGNGKEKERIAELIEIIKERGDLESGLVVIESKKEEENDEDLAHSIPIIPIDLTSYENMIKSVEEERSKRTKPAFFGQKKDSYIKEYKTKLRPGRKWLRSFFCQNFLSIIFLTTYINIK